MLRSYFVWAAAALLLLAAVGFGGWVVHLPTARSAFAPPPIPSTETEAMLAALKPETRGRPLVAVIGLNDATETTDYLMPTGILRRADIADVVMLATEPGPVQLYPAFKVEADATVAKFDTAHPDGADYVIVPAMSRDDDPAVISWLRRQAKLGARIIGVCAGAKIVGAAGLLDGKRATTHWYYLPKMLNRSPDIAYVADRRMVTDGNVTTTTGISAAMPMMLTLIEAIAGRAKAEAVADDLGMASWSARHSSAAFRLTRPFAATVLANRMSFWRHEEIDLRIEPGMDEVSLALVADTWSRTYRSKVVTYSTTAEPTATRGGVRIIPDEARVARPGAMQIGSIASDRPAAALDRALEEVADRYGRRTADVVAMQLEYRAAAR